MASLTKYSEAIVYDRFTGVDYGTPENMLAPNAARYVDNFLVIRGELVSRAELRASIPPVPDALPVRALLSFMNSNNIVCTVAITQAALYVLNSASTSVNAPQAWTQVALLPGVCFDIITPYQIFLGNLYFSMGDELYQFDGVNLSITSVATLTGATTSAGAFYIGELAAHVLMFSTMEFGSTSVEYFPQRIRWSASGLPNVWDPTVNTSAGFTDLLDCSDIITGFAALGQNGYIFRTNGITEMVPTGQGAEPFIFNHLWAANYGVGNIIGSSLASYGAFSIFVASDNIYQMTATALNTIGDQVIAQVLEDLSNAGINMTALRAGVVGNSYVIGSVIPQLSRGLAYLSYVLTIPQDSGGAIMYVYNIVAKVWTRHVVGVVPTSRANYIITV